VKYAASLVTTTSLMNVDPVAKLYVRISAPVFAL